MAHLSPNLALWLLLAMTAAAAKEPLINPGTANLSLPIDLDAESSEFDRQNDRLRFSGLRIRQGDLSIIADSADANRLDFDDSVWVFTGNVRIENSTTKVWSDRAEVRFLKYQVGTADLQGQPARFEQRRLTDGMMTRGRANTMEYTLQTRVIRMAGDAWLSDGGNEVSGARIAYDLDREVITADSDASGQVRMKIVPPESRQTPPPAVQDSP